MTKVVEVTKVGAKHASDFLLKRPSKTWHLFVLSVIVGADNQKLTVRVRVRQVAADQR